MRIGKLVVVLVAACSDSSGTPPAVDGSPADAGVDSSPGDRLFEESFASDGNAWPAGWRELGGVASATVGDGRGSLVPAVTSYSLARIGRDLDAADVEVTFTLQMTDLGRQGVGLYVRQTGGYLGQTSPTGGGYAVFVEGFRGPAIGLWRERDGNEELLGATVATTLANDTAYAVRFRCVQAGGATMLSAKIWLASDAEPAAWTVERVDDTPALQSAAGGIAVDSWTTAIPGQGVTPTPILVDDIVVTAAP